MKSRRTLKDKTMGDRSQKYMQFFQSIKRFDNGRMSIMSNYKKTARFGGHSKASGNKSD